MKELTDYLVSYSNSVWSYYKNINITIHKLGFTNKISVKYILFRLKKICMKRFLLLIIITEIW